VKASSTLATGPAHCAGVVDYLSPWGKGTAVGDGLIKLNADYAAAHGGCKAELVFVSSDNTVILEKLVGMVAAGTPPAAALIPAQQTPLWITKGIVQPLTALAQRDKLTKQQFFAGYWPPMYFRGQLWRLPFQIDVNFPWYWNIVSLQHAGLAPDKGPATIATLDQWALKLTQRQGSTFLQIGMVPWSLYGPENSLQSWAYAFGGDFMNAAGTKITADDPKTVRALHWMATWANQLGGYTAVQKFLSGLPNGFVGGLVTGKLAMGGMTSSTAATVTKIQPGAQLGAGLFPGAPPVPPGAATWLSGRGVGIVKGTNYLEEAWSFVHWVGASDAGTLAAATDIGAVPGWRSSPGLRLLEQNANTAPAIRALRVARHSPPGAILPIDLWGNNRGQLIVAALQQQRTAADVLAEVARTAQAELDSVLAAQKQ
jgi:ABC-type glycerol-3-phosphate transport system substrate-binding protein